MPRPDAQKILTVDDEQDIIELLSYNLSREGFEVTTAMDGEEASFMPPYSPAKFHKNLTAFSYSFNTGRIE